MQGHAAANVVPVIAANRIGMEEVHASDANGGQESTLCFYGSSFMTDGTGDIIKSASRDQEEILVSSYDLEALTKERLDWGLFRDRRPGCYQPITN